MSESSDSDKGRSQYQNRHVDRGPDLKVNGRDLKENDNDLKVKSDRMTVYFQQDLNIKICGRNFPSHPGSISF